MSLLRNPMPDDDTPQVGDDPGPVLPAVIRDRAGYTELDDELMIRAADVLAILANDQPERVASIYDGRRGTVTEHSFNEYAYVSWDDGTRYFVSEDSLMPESELEVQT